MIIKKEKLFCIFSYVGLMFVFNSYGGFSKSSPALAVSAFLLFLSILIWMNKVLIKSRVKFFDPIHFFFLHLIFILSFSGADIVKDLGRLVYLHGCLSLIPFILRSRSEKEILFTTLIILFSDLVFRSVSGFPYTNIYTLKSSYILVDTNFIGQLILSILIFIPFWKSKTWLFLLISTFSRTAWAGYIFIRLSRGTFLIPVIIILTMLVIYINGDDFIRQFDGSLRTKLEIMAVFLNVLSLDNINIILFGAGKLEVFSWLKETHNYSGTVGHTIFGLILELGLLQIILFFFTVNLYLCVDQKSKFWFPIIFMGVAGLFILTYLGLACIMAICAWRTYVKKNVDSDENF